MHRALSPTRPTGTVWPIPIRALCVDIRSGSVSMFGISCEASECVHTPGSTLAWSTVHLHSHASVCYILTRMRVAPPVSSQLKHTQYSD